MATILEFRRTKKTAARIGKPVEGSLGEIVIFPGVRIERRMSSELPKGSRSTTCRRAPRARKKSRA
jgi:hypothetical protein